MERVDFELAVLILSCALVQPLLSNDVTIPRTYRDYILTTPEHIEVAQLRRCHTVFMISIGT